MYRSPKYSLSICYMYNTLCKFLSFYDYTLTLNYFWMSEIRLNLDWQHHFKFIQSSLELPAKSLWYIQTTQIYLYFSYKSERLYGHHIISGYRKFGQAGSTMDESHFYFISSNFVPHIGNSKPPLSDPGWKLLPSFPLITFD